MDNLELFSNKRLSNVWFSYNQNLFQFVAVWQYIFRNKN